MAANTAVNLLLAASLNQLWSMINTQQLIVMTPLFHVQIPALAGIFFRHLMEIAAFDFFEFDEDIYELF